MSTIGPSRLLSRAAGITEECVRENVTRVSDFHANIPEDAREKWVKEILKLTNRACSDVRVRVGTVSLSPPSKTHSQRVYGVWGI